MSAVLPKHPVVFAAQDKYPTWRGHVPYRDRIETLRNALLATHPGLAEAIVVVPFDQFETAFGPATAIQEYHAVSESARALVAAIPAELQTPWLCALLIWHTERFDAVFAATGLHAEFALHYADCFHRIFDQIETKPDFAVLTKDSFLKDLWLTRVVMIPAFAALYWPRAGLSAKTVLKGGVAAMRYVFFRCGGRRPFLEGHTHDPMVRAYWNEAGWGETMRLGALALQTMPRTRGMFGASWYYDPAVLAINPQLSYTHALQVGRGACRFKIGSNPGAIAHALAASASRRNRYRDGTYLPTDYAIVWSRKDMIAAYG